GGSKHGNRAGLNPTWMRLLFRIFEAALLLYLQSPLPYRVARDFLGLLLAVRAVIVLVSSPLPGCRLSAVQRRYQIARRQLGTLSHRCCDWLITRKAGYRSASLRSLPGSPLHKALHSRAERFRASCGPRYNP